MLVDGAPNDPNEWAYEIKFDGYRVLARIGGERIQLFTRNGNDWSHKLPHIEKAIAAMGFSKRLAGWWGSTRPLIVVWIWSYPSTGFSGVSSIS
ncbi:hypothetical protein [Nitrosovibrio sp. Nv6]|uniref:ATP-dependent DNA ligase n=1 Tax=Nitrosovibrio sp. Nv6 TaxID=1855340 RepID=UPI000EB34A57|nr:hypothetical protein [Nitrosovibrio sp. Nv6]